jgi:hypothetical protein
VFLMSGGHASGAVESGMGDVIGAAVGINAHGGDVKSGTGDRSGDIAHTRLTGVVLLGGDDHIDDAAAGEVGKAEVGHGGIGKSQRSDGHAEIDAPQNALDELAVFGNQGAECVFRCLNLLGQRGDGSGCVCQEALSFRRRKGNSLGLTVDKPGELAV